METHPLRFDNLSVADNYQFRIPYIPAFFRDLAGRVELTPADSPLDLCCGQGEISKLLCAYASRISAVDVSIEMIRRAHMDPKISYLIADVNDPEFPARFNGQRFSHCFVGRAIHWIEQESLIRLTRTIFQDSMWFVTMQGGFSDQTPWLATFNKVKRRHLGPSHNLDHVARDRILDAGFGFKGDRAAIFKMELSIGYLYRNALSYSNAGSHSESAFKSDLKQSLAPWMEESGKLIAKVTNTALIYRLGDAGSTSQTSSLN